MCNQKHLHLPYTCIEAKKDEITEVVSTDARAQKETMVVSLVDASVTQGTVVATLGLVYLTGGAVTKLFTVIVRQARC